MIAYLLNLTLCSGCLLLFYRAVLEREKMFGFNRYYLLGTLLLSVVLPLIPVEIFTNQVLFEPPASAAQLAEKGIQARYTVALVPEPVLPESFEWAWVLAAAYFFVSFGFLVRFGRNVLRLIGQSRRNEILHKEGMALVLVESPTLPHSFLKYIFLNKTEYLSGHVAREIIAHERAHVRQWHSLDILLVELMKVLFWFNPVFYLYRNAIALNHEFLADEAVLTNCRDISTYQYLLLQKAIAPSHEPFTSTFNYSFTKKRFIMMNKHTSRTRALLTQMAALPLIALAFFAFSDLTLAQIAPPPPPVERAPPPPPVERNGLSDLVKEYNALVNKYLDNSKPNFTLIKTPSQTDGARMEQLLTAMTEEQKTSLDYTIYKLKPLVKAAPTREEYEKYKEPTMYGVWIDDKKVPNSELNKYKPTDFSHVFSQQIICKCSENHRLQIQVSVEFDDQYLLRSLPERST